jgi:hypothetical protein
MVELKELKIVSEMYGEPELRRDCVEETHAE